MSNNTKRLSFFAKIAQRSTALQSLLEVATGKSAVGGIAPDGAGRQDYPTPPDPYTTERYEKDIALANTTPVPTEAINPNLESRIKHVKEFYRGESVYFMKEVGIQRYPNHYHVAWTVPSVADGTLSATANGFPLFNGEAVIEGATIVLTATPASGKQVGQWSGLPQGATTAGNTATFTLAADVDAGVTFAAAVDYFCITPDEANTSLDVRFSINSAESDSNDEPELNIEYSTDKVTWHEQKEYAPDYITIDKPGFTDVHFNYMGAVEYYHFWVSGEEGSDEEVVATASRTPSEGEEIYEVGESGPEPSDYTVASFNPGSGYIKISGSTYFRGSFSQGTLLFDVKQPVAFSLSGHLSTLVNGTNTLTADLPEEAFYEFMYRANVTDASGLILPDSHLSSNCFEEMFYGCTALTSAPALPAKVLAESCYLYMFRDCTALTEAPDLPATTLTEDCYYSMFKDCTSLVTAPSLPATTLTDGCYYYMFNGCISLTGPVNIAATSPYYEGTTACDEMFAGSGTEVGAGGTINVGGNADDWYSAAVIDDQRWTVQVLPSEE